MKILEGEKSSVPARSGLVRGRLGALPAIMQEKDAAETAAIISDNAALI